ncbi:DUF2007 domain-containing protein [uncultured Dokdonia sp.]|uniref:DUF2007 domain-containing protein n=1 Tax=uncultured Dokdonia sp. TaxID=575653 RepID=UPI0030EBDA81|tara:strand:+ start:184347 stop:184763 length:417 start_codon:yes stop_codon:yes gene_type:complete
MSNTFVTIAQFQYSSEAQIFKGRLLAEGIEAFLADNYTIDTDPLVSNAIGGVKLRVPSDQESRAKEILGEISAYSVAEDGSPVHCPNCNSEEVALFTTVSDIRSLGAFLLGFVFGALPFYTKYEYRCDNCKTKFNEIK